MVDQVYADWRTAEVRPQVRAALGFLEKLIKTPEALAVADVKAVYATGVTREGLVKAVQICAAFSTIVRAADTFEFAISTPEEFAASADMLLKRGYILP